MELVLYRSTDGLKIAFELKQVGFCDVSMQDAKQTKVVLLAEDDSINVEIVRHILSQRQDFELVVAYDGRAALELALNQRFDLMIFDRNMPYISGDRVIRHLKAASTVNEMTPVIQFTAGADRVSMGSRSSVLADAIVPKPVQAAQLLSVIENFLPTDSQRFRF